MKRNAILIALLVLSLMTASATWAQENPCNPCGPKKAANPCNPCGGKATVMAAMPAVNPCHAKHGTVFYIADPMGRNTISFTSQAPLEDIIGTTNQIAGYVVFDPKNPINGGRGQFNVSTASLKTGIPLRDEHLQGKDWLDAKKYPSISLGIESVKDVKVVKETASYKTYELEIEGSFSLHGKSKRIKVPARMTYLPESEQTRQKMPGDLLAGRASFDVALTEFGIKGFEGVVGSKVSEMINVDVSFMASNKKPAAENPCNPCGGKAKNPCNPCGGKAKNPCNPCGGKKKR